MRWVRHMTHMWEKKNAHRVLVEIPEGKKLLEIFR
jgi:hypothetical protein